MSDLRDLYQDVILEHARSPRNFHALPGARSAEGFNPLCGDHFTVYLALDGEVVKDCAFTGLGCAISTASASVMTDLVRGKRQDDVQRMFRGFHDLVTGRSVGEDMGKLAVFGGVAEFPARVKCASLAWHALNAALAGQAEAVSTE